MNNSNIVYQLSREDLRQELRALFAEIGKEDYFDRKKEGGQELQSVPFVADFLKVNPQTVRNMITRGCIRSVRIGRRVMCDMGQLRRDVEAGKVGKGKHTKERR